MSGHLGGTVAFVKSATGHVPIGVLWEGIIKRKGPDGTGQTGE